MGKSGVTFNTTKPNHDLVSKAKHLTWHTWIESGVRNVLTKD
jgi:hypothetical protein